jgi:hypothetical protein
MIVIREISVCTFLPQLTVECSFVAKILHTRVDLDLLGIWFGCVNSKLLPEMLWLYAQTLSFMSGLTDELVSFMDCYCSVVLKLSKTKYSVFLAGTKLQQKWECWLDVFDGRHLRINSAMN